MTHPVWLDAAVALEERIEALMDDLSEDDLARVMRGDFAPFGDRGMPEPTYVDSGTGLRGVAGATALPAGVALAATFDEALALEYGAAVGREARRAGFNVVLGPTLDLARDPLGGRLAEAFGEDPVLSGRLGAAHVRALQAEDVIAQVKHYVAYTTETRRTGHGLLERGDALDVRTSEPLLHDLYLRPFESAVRAGAWSLMGSYNRLNGAYVCESPEILSIPREVWGWRGFYCPDFLFAVRDPRAALEAGLDLGALGGDGGRTRRMLEEAHPDLLRAGVANVARALIGSGVVDHPADPSPEVSSSEHRDLATRTTVAGTVLLRNTGLLPLAESVRSVAVIGPAGADAFPVGGGAASVSLTPDRITWPLEAIQERAGGRLLVRHAQGSLGDVPLPLVPDSVLTTPDGEPGVLVEFDDGTRRTVRHVDHRADISDLGAPWPSRWRARLTPRTTGTHRLSVTVGGSARLRLDGQEVMTGSREVHQFLSGPHYPLQAVVHLEAGVPVDLEIDYEVGPGIVIPPMGLGPSLALGWQEPDGMLDDAVALARECQVAVVFVTVASGEGMDRDTMALPGDQDDLVRRVAEANPNTVVVVNAPGAVLMPWHEDVAAVLHVWFPGEGYGPALASMLFGDAEPGGRLPVTIPKQRDHLPATGRDAMVADYGADGGIGYRSPAVLEHGALFPFGWGLGYEQLAVEVSGRTDGARLGLEVVARNTGRRGTSHVAQVYVSAHGTEPWELVDWAKLAVPAGGTARATLELTPESLRRWDASARRRVPVPGNHRVKVSAHAEDPGVQFDWGF